MYNLAYQWVDSKPYPLLSPEGYHLNSLFPSVAHNYDDFKLN